MLPSRRLYWLYCVYGPTIGSAVNQVNVWGSTSILKEFARLQGGRLAGVTVESTRRNCSAQTNMKD